MPSELMQDSSRATVITLPDPWAAWPWTRRVNQFHAKARTDSTAWIRSYKVYSPEAQRAFELCDNCLLVSLAYPDVNEEQLRLICDLLQFLYVFDDRAETADEQSAQTMASAIMSGLRDGSYSENDVGAAMARDFWQRLTAVMTNEMYQRRLVAFTQEYTDAVVQEARDHNTGHIPTVPEYFALRRKTSAIYPFWVLLHINMDLPEVVFDHPMVQELEQVTADILIICNDIVSYKPEALRGSHGLGGKQGQRVDARGAERQVEAAHVRRERGP